MAMATLFVRGAASGVCPRRLKAAVTNSSEKKMARRCRMGSGRQLGPKKQLRDGIFWMKKAIFGLAKRNS